MLLATDNKKRLLKRFNKSKKGFTLVEVLASAFVLVIVFTGVLSAVAFSRQMVFTDNEREKASDEAQLIADEIISVAKGSADISDASTKIADYYTALSTPKNVADMTAFGFSYSGGTTESKYQYTLAESSDNCTDTDTSGLSGTLQGKVTTQQGFDLTVRVYYQRINGGGGYDCVEVTAFVPSACIS